jgi:hypothetical protein
VGAQRVWSRTFGVSAEVTRELVASMRTVPRRWPARGRMLEPVGVGCPEPDRAMNFWAQIAISCRSVANARSYITVNVCVH